MSNIQYAFYELAEIWMDGESRDCEPVWNNFSFTKYVNFSKGHRTDSWYPVGSPNMEHTSTAYKAIALESKIYSLKSFM